MFHLRYNNIPVSALDIYRELILNAINNLDKEQLPPEVEYDTYDAAAVGMVQLHTMIPSLDIVGLEVVRGECPYLSSMGTWANKQSSKH